MENKFKYLLTIIIILFANKVHPSDNFINSPSSVYEYLFLLNTTKYVIRNDMLCKLFINNKIYLSENINDDILKLLNNTYHFNKDKFFLVGVKLDGNYLNFIHEFNSCELNKCNTECIVFEELLLNQELYNDFNEKGKLSIIKNLSNWYEYFLLKHSIYNNDYSNSFTINYIDLSDPSSKGKLELQKRSSLKEIHNVILNKKIYYLSPSSIYIKFREDEYTISFSMWESYLNYNKLVYKDEVELIFKYENDATKLIRESHKIISIPKRFFEGEDYSFSNTPLIYPDITERNMRKIKLLYPKKTELNAVKSDDIVLLDSLSQILLRSLWGREIKGKSIHIMDIFTSFKRIPDIPSFENIQVPFKQKVLEAYVRTWNIINNPGKIELLFEDIAPPNVINKK